MFCLGLSFWASWQLKMQWLLLFLSQMLKGICLYAGVGCFLCIHVVALTFVIIKKTNFILLIIKNALSKNY